MIKNPKMEKKSGKFKPIRRIALKETLTNLPIGGYCELTSNDIARDNLRSYVSQLKRQTGVAYTVTTINKDNYRVTRTK